MKNFEKSSEELQQLWDKGKPLEEALYKFSSSQLVSNTDVPFPEFQKKENLSPIEDILKPFSNYLGKISDSEFELKEHFRFRLYKESLIAVGYKIPRNPEDAPIYIPKDIWQGGQINWKKSTVKGQGLEFVSIRVVRKQKQKARISVSNLKIMDKKVGRPSIRDRLLNVYSQLKNQRLIDFHKTFKAHVPLIQESVKRLYDNPDNKGMSYKTIQAHLGSIFNKDKAVLKSI